MHLAQTNDVPREHPLEKMIRSRLLSLAFTQILNLPF
jgi:hypothetical protein